MKPFRESYSLQIPCSMVPNGFAYSVKFLRSCFLKSEAECQPQNFTPVNIAFVNIKPVLKRSTNLIHLFGVCFQRTDKCCQRSIPDAHGLLLFSIVDSLKLTNNIIDERLSVISLSSFVETVSLRSLLTECIEIFIGHSILPPAVREVVLPRRDMPHVPSER